MSASAGPFTAPEQRRRPGRRVACRRERGFPMASRRPRRSATEVAAGLALVVATLLAGASPASGEPPELRDEELRARVEARLAALPDREGADIRVAVRDGQVLLQGRVLLLEQSLRAEQAAWKTPGVLDVDNELRVIPLATGVDASIERQVRMIVKADGRFLDTNLEIEVTAGLVQLRGLFQDPADVFALKHRIATIPGVLRVEIEAVLLALRGGPRLERTERRAS